MFDADADAGGLAGLRERVRPVSTSRSQLLPVLPALKDVLPEGGLRRGTTLSVTADDGGGGTTLALALVAAASKAGSWCVTVGIDNLGALSAVQQLDLSRSAFVSWSGGEWAKVVARLVDGVDIVLLHPPPHVRATQARKLVARLRDRGSVLVILLSGVLQGRSSTWPEPCDLNLHVASARWVGIGPGEDCLRERLATITVQGRRAAGRLRQIQLWLPSASRTVTKVEGP
jgi:hypothetical protein